jgi:hypothetical protein
MAVQAGDPVRSTKTSSAGMRRLWKISGERTRRKLASKLSHFRHLKVLLVDLRESNHLVWFLLRSHDRNQL